MPSFLFSRLIFTVKERCIRITNFGWKGKHIPAYIWPNFVLTNNCDRSIIDTVKYPAPARQRNLPLERGHSMRIAYLSGIILAILAIIGSTILGLPYALSVASSIALSRAGPRTSSSPWVIPSNPVERSAVFVVMIVMIAVISIASVTLSIHLVKRFGKGWRRIACIILLFIFLCFLPLYGFLCAIIVLGNGIGN